MSEPDVIAPSRVWMRRAFAFSAGYSAIVLVGGYFVPWVLLLLPFVGYRAFYAWSALRPGKVGIELYTDYLVCKSPFRQPVEVKKQDVFKFLAVYRGTTEIVVARMQDVDARGEEGRILYHPSDVVMPRALMRNPDLVRRLEGWRSAATYARGI